MWQEVWIGRALVHAHCSKPFASTKCGNKLDWKSTCPYTLEKSIQIQRSSVHIQEKITPVLQCVCTDAFSFWMSCHMWCRQETFLQCVWTGAFPIWILLHVLQAKGCLQCLCSNALPMWTSCHIWGSLQGRFFFSVYGAVLFHFKFLNTCRMFFTSVYDLMLTTAYCG